MIPGCRSCPRAPSALLIERHDVELEVRPNDARGRQGAPQRHPFQLIEASSSRRRPARTRVTSSSGW
jgi:hypothetical protein